MLLFFCCFFSVPPQINLQSASDKDLGVILESAIFIDCPVVGIPLPTVKWYKDDKMIDFDDQTHLMLFAGGRRLQISNTTLDDKGQYRCVATNEAGKIKRLYNVDIYGRFYVYFQFLMFIFSLKIFCFLISRWLYLLFFFTLRKY